MATGNAAQQAVAGLPPLTQGGTPTQNKNMVYGDPTQPLTLVPMYATDTGGGQQFWAVSTAKKAAPILPAKIKDTLTVAMDKVYGVGQWKQKDLSAAWSTAVDQSAMYLNLENKIAYPQDLFSGIIGNLAANGLSGTGTTGAGGTSHSTQKSVNLSDPSTARGLIDTALSNHLGRQANPQEQAAFLKALNIQQEASPTFTEQTTTTSGKNSSSTSQTTGGFNASTFADEYAAGQEGAGEFQAATTLLDSFIGALGAKV